MVLNRSWRAIGMVTLKRAIILTCKGHAKIVQAAANDWIQNPILETFSWPEWQYVDPGDDCIHSAMKTFRVPKVIVLLEYDKLPGQHLKFSRRSVCRRDDSTCQYCGETKTEITIDHVVPKSQGGRSTWENCVVACRSCNSRKADRTPEQAGMKLRFAPVKPKWNLIRGETNEPAWKMFT